VQVHQDDTDETILAILDHTHDTYIGTDKCQKMTLEQDGWRYIGNDGTPRNELLLDRATEMAQEQFQKVLEA
jgi:hypothetical protein